MSKCWCVLRLTDGTLRVLVQIPDEELPPFLPSGTIAAVERGPCRPAVFPDPDAAIAAGQKFVDLVFRKALNGADVKLAEVLAVAPSAKTTVT